MKLAARPPSAGVLVFAARLPSVVMERVAIGLGSNIGDSQAHFAAAIAALRGHAEISNVVMSPLFSTRPVGVLDQPDFLNAAATFATTLSAPGLLQFLRLVESARGRNRAIERRWGPRTLDLDMLLFGDLVISSPGLDVPHLHMKTRRFVLEPLAQIAGDWLVPPGLETVQELLQALNACDHC